MGESDQRPGMQVPSNQDSTSLISGSPCPLPDPGPRVDANLPKDCIHNTEYSQQPDKPHPLVMASVPADQQQNLDRSLPRLRCSNILRTGGLELSAVQRLMEPLDKAIDARSGRFSNTEFSTRVSNPAYRRNSTNDLAGCSCKHLLSGLRSHLPLRRDADALVSSYFARPHQIYPVIHEPTFRKQYVCLWQAQTTTPSPSDCSGICKQKSRGKTFPALVHIVLALATLFQSRSLGQNNQTADDYFRLAQEIDLLEIMDYEIGIELIQLCLLMGFYLPSTERYSKCWNIIGLTIRMAQSMGLHLSLDDARRKGLFPHQATQIECELRKRVWAACVLLDRYVLGKHLLDYMILSVIN